MSKIQKVILKLNNWENRQNENGLPPGKIESVILTLSTFVYIIICLSFNRQQLNILLLMGIVLIVFSAFKDISLMRGVWNGKWVFLFLLFLGIAGLFYDREVVMKIGSINITGGMLSLFVIFVKEIYSLMAVWCLIQCIGIYGICKALNAMRVPGSFVTMIWLIYRYLIVLLKEADSMIQSYSLRAPGQKGLNIKVWGSFIGMLLIRSTDRASELYESMKLRGYDED